MQLLDMVVWLIIFVFYGIILIDFTSEGHKSHQKMMRIGLQKHHDTCGSIWTQRKDQKELDRAFRLQNSKENEKKVHGILRKMIPRY